MLNVLLPPLDQSGDCEALSDDWRDILGDQRQHLHDFGTEILPSLIQVSMFVFLFLSSMMTKNTPFIFGICRWLVLRQIPVCAMAAFV